MDSLEKVLSRLPIIPVAFMICMWMAWDYYSWTGAQDSELGQKQTQIANLQQQIQEAKGKVKSAEDFMNNIDILRSRIRQLTTQLDGVKTSLNAELDVSNFVRMVNLETKKLGIYAKGFRPEAEVQKEHYTEAPFTMTLRGAYLQLLVFFDRISRMQQMIRVADFEMKPTGSALTKYVELEGKVQLVTYKYRGNKVDEIIHRPEMKANEEVKQ